MEKTMQGALFLNDKGDNEARPDFRGKLTLDEGKILQVSAWKSVSRDGKPYLSCKCDWQNIEKGPSAEESDDKAWDFGEKKEVVETDDNIPF
jgi:uncharacterized protein (DUF736 family)